MLCPALVPALDKEVDLFFWMMLDVVEVKPLYYPVHIEDLEFTTVYTERMQESIAQVCLLWLSNGDEETIVMFSNYYLFLQHNHKLTRIYAQILHTVLN